jgi:hypothetical protein
MICKILAMPVVTAMALLIQSHTAAIITIEVSILVFGLFYGMY